jgi:hypothetical protein
MEPQDRMNYISSFRIDRHYDVAMAGYRTQLLLVFLVVCGACSAPASESPPPSDALNYRIDYTVSPDPTHGSVLVTLKLKQPRALLRQVIMRPDDRVSEFRADGELDVGVSKVRWNPPASGGVLSWRVQVAHRRNNGGYDAWLGANWGLFRAEDIIPRAATRTLKGAKSDTHLSFELPRGWSAVTQYFDKNGKFHVKNRERRFDQPSGWIVIGQLGVRREKIAGMRVAIAGPVGNSVRRLDTLALLNWTLPELLRLLPALPRRLTIVSAGEPMWRGGLSAPLSLYVHSDRPLISENATSTLLHEVMHLTLGLSADDGYDWIVEGLAEYYSLELLGRSGTISDARYKLAKADLVEWAESATSLCQQTSTGATTALATKILSAVNQDIRSGSEGNADLDDVVRELTRVNGPIGLRTLSDVAEQFAGHKLDVLHIDNLPGCRNISSASLEM